MHTALKGFVAAAMLASGMAGGTALLAGEAAAQTSELHTQGRECRNLGKSNKAFERNYYVYFETNSSRVDPKYQKEFERIVKFAKGQKAGQICLFGKASKVGDPAANIALSQKRARNVAAGLEAAGWPRSKVPRPASPPPLACRPSS